jgi:hypothetical protein
MGKDMLIDPRTPRQQIISKISKLTGNALINAIADLPDPGTFVRQLPADDFYRIIKRVGEEDCLPVLQWASTSQWQHVLDLEIWENDQIDFEETLQWFERFVNADPKRFSFWALEEEPQLLALTLTKTAEIIFKEDQDDSNIPPGYQTLDGCFYFKSIDAQNSQTISDVLSALAQHANGDYPNFLFHLPAVIPAETEEELYRLRNNRLAEYGFPAHDEAVEVYAPLDISAIHSGRPRALPGLLAEHEGRHLIPTTPWNTIGDFPLLARAFSGIADNIQADRVRLEFAVLCNTLIAADNFVGVENDDDLVRISRKAAGYLDIALEKMSERAVNLSDILMNNPLQMIFRVGYGLAMQLQWRAKRWIKESWFFQERKPLSFWGPKYSAVLEALLSTRPNYVARDSNGSFRHFESHGELKETAQALGQVEAIDKMIARLTRFEGTPAPFDPTDYNTFYPVLFNRWAHHLLNHQPSFAPLSTAQARRFFRLLREGEAAPPFSMPKYRHAFIDEFMKSAVDWDEQSRTNLHDALDYIWSEFRSEYENVLPADLDARFSAFLKIVPHLSNEQPVKKRSAG